MGDDRAPVPRDPGELIASGRTADVFDIGDDKVLRRYRTDTPSVHHERRVMRFMAGHGVPVPEVFDLGPSHLSERDIVMERVDGLTMFDDLVRRPWMIRSHARLLDQLLSSVAEVPAPDWMMSPGWQPSSRHEGHRDSVIHLDLHPANVLLSRTGAVVIGWGNATGGPAGFDAAMTSVVLTTYEVDMPRDQVLQRLLAAMFRRASGARVIDAYLAAACAHRLADPHITPGERVNVAALRTRALTRNG